jgi:hypothetical protein
MENQASALVQVLGTYQTLLQYSTHTAPVSIPGAQQTNQTVYMVCLALTAHSYGSDDRSKRFHAPLIR